MTRALAAAVGGLAVVCSVVAVVGNVGAQTIPPGYTEVPGSPDAVLNPAHRGAVGSEFQQDCSGVPIPVPTGGVVWHFILPQNDRDLFAPSPDNIFVSLTVEFEAAGAVTLTAFGPPSAAHAWIATSTDDTLLDGEADGAERRGDGFPRQFNLSHTCAAPNVVPPASTTTTTTTTSTTTPELGSFPIAKTFSGSASGTQGPVVFEIHCTSPPNGPIPSWLIPAGATGTVTTVVTGVTLPAQCEVTEIVGGDTETVYVARDGARPVRQEIDLCPTGAASPRSLPGFTFENVVEPAPTTSTSTTVPDPTSTTTTSTTTSTSTSTSTTGPTVPGTTDPPPVDPPECEIAPPTPSTSAPPGTAPVTSAPTTSVAPLPPVLPETGRSGGPVALIAVVALIAGAALVTVAARRTG